MNVKELIDELSKQDPDSLVMVSCTDGDGTDFHAAIISVCKKHTLTYGSPDNPVVCVPIVFLE